MSATTLPERILSISPEVTVSPQNYGLRLLGAPGKPIHLEFASGRAFLLRKETAGWFVLPSDPEHASLQGDTLTWVLPLRVDDPGPAWLVRAVPGSLLTVQIGQTVAVQVESESVEVVRFENRPRADLFGRRFHLRIDSGEALEQALAAFYWDTIQPCVVERTRAAAYPTPDGYVLSTLAANYGGTYPDVDHEFQIKGRLAAGSALDQDVCRRMLELQFRLMREDPEGLWRNPCAIQPDGSREYHVRRSSLDGSTTATMFLITGNVEVLEETWLYTTATQDRAWLAAHILDLEGAASEIEAWVDLQGRLWSDVYFEDQVMQDGRVCDAQAFAAHGLRRLAELEVLPGSGKAGSGLPGPLKSVIERAGETPPRGLLESKNPQLLQLDRPPGKGSRPHSPSLERASSPISVYLSGADPGNSQSGRPEPGRIPALPELRGAGSIGVHRR